MHHGHVEVVPVAGRGLPRPVPLVHLPRNLNILMLKQLRIGRDALQVELLRLDDHGCLDVLVNADAAALLPDHVAVRWLRQMDRAIKLLLLIIPQPTLRVLRRMLHALLLVLHLRVVQLLLLLVRVIVLLNHLLERIIGVFRTLLANYLVHVSGCAINYGWLWNAIRSTATLGSRALARVVVGSEERAALLH